MNSNTANIIKEKGNMEFLENAKANFSEISALVGAYCFLLDRGHHEAAHDLAASVKETYPKQLWDQTLRDHIGASDDEPEDY